MKFTFRGKKYKTTNNTIIICLIILLIIAAIIITLIFSTSTPIFINEYNEEELANGEWTEAEYLGYHIDTTTVNIIAVVNIDGEEYRFYCDKEPDIKLYSIISVYITEAGEILAVREE